jgi:cobalt-precorrin 5A hydrolase/precorrin-3B C17-methyltransferase
VQALVAQVFKAHNLAMGAVAGVVSIDLKSDEPAILNMAESLNVPFRCFDAATLEQERPRLHNPSDIVFAEVGCHGVAEGAALAAVGADGILRVAKHKGDKCTCAIAQAAAPIDIAQVGKPRGRLFIVGIGPGQSSWRTPEADKMLALADHIVGYGLYLNLIQAQIEGKQQHIFPLGEEEDRVRHALELAATGKQVALVSSGDAGIYAMAALAFELLDREQRADWGRIDIAVTPGITAMQAAAARAGAPLGHDFCAISLSNLLTPWEHIEKRLYAAADGDFVVSFYNPVSLRRRWQLPKAIDILRTKRAADTPVLLSSNLGRPTESVRHTTLGALHVDDVDMLTIVTVGASISRSFAGTGGRRWMYTPRGYAKKMDTPDLISDGGTPVITKTTDCE